MSGTWPWDGLGAKGIIGLMCESLMKEVVGGVDPGLADLYIKDLFKGKLFTVFRKYVSREGSSLLN